MLVLFESQSQAPIFFLDFLGNFSKWITNPNPYFFHFWPKGWGSVSELASLHNFPTDSRHSCFDVSCELWRIILFLSMMKPWRDTIEFQTNLRRILIVWSNIFTSYFILVRHPFLRFFLWGTSGFVFHIHLQRLVGGTSIFSQIKCFYSVLLGSFFEVPYCINSDYFTFPLRLSMLSVLI